MTETQKRIQDLKRTLPGVKERIVSVAIMLAMSLAMMTSVSYAWFSMSTAPELGGVKTTISSNGNLEVALSDKDGKAPDKSGIGDSFSAEGQGVHAANTSWGNLINLSNEYGIENLILRPAKLDTTYPALLTGAKYGEDGRYETTATDFGFTTWGLDTTTNQYDFLVPKEDAFGVRAISSVGYAQGEGRDPLQIALENARAKNAQAKSQYEALMNKETTQGAANLAVIQELVTAFVQSKLSNSSTSFNNRLPEVYAMMDGLYQAVLTYGDALTELAKIQQKAYCEKNNIFYTAYTRETLTAATKAQLQANGVYLESLYDISSNDYLNNKDQKVSRAGYLTLEKNIRIDRDTIAEFMNAGRDITWDDLYPIVNRLINMSDVTIGGMTMSDISDNPTSALGVLSGNQPVITGQGYMYDIELLTGARMTEHSPTITVKVKVLMTFTINGMLSSKLSKDSKEARYTADHETTRVEAGANEFKGNMVALDTYGMVIDLWVRTNAADSYLGLDGLLDVETYYEQLQGKVILNGEVVSIPLWTYTYYTGEKMEVNGIEMPVTEDMTVYVIPQDLNPADPEKPGTPEEYEITFNVNETETKTVKVSEGIFYDYKTNDEVFRIGSDGKPISSGTDDAGNPIYQWIDHTDIEVCLEKKENVLGFQGSNRVDDDYILDLAPGEVSATQGSGSCYIFYADSPEAAANSKELLRNMKLAFLDVNNKVLARAEMDVDHMLAQAGKYIVPIVVKTSSYQVDGVNYIMPLVQNEATRISVLVYLDGTALENSMVMSKDSIIGSLNIQFASSEKLLDTKDDMELENQTISINAGIKNGNETIHEMTFAYDGIEKNVTLNANVYGVSPNSVLAYFQRKINNSQGTRMDAVELKKQTGPDGIYYSGVAKFLTPGTYILRSLVVDGVEYDLPEPITVLVEGRQITFVNFDESMELTADSFVERDIEVAIQADANTRPDRVQARFLSDSGEYVSGTLTWDSNSVSASYPYGLWKGKVRFTSSGTYTLVFIVMDGEYTEVPDTLQRSFTAYMGLRARVNLTREGGLTFRLEGPQTVGVRVDILNDKGEEMKSLTNVNLYYARRGSTSLADQLHAELEWKGGHYVADEMLVNAPGTFLFSAVEVGDNRITIAESAPTIVAQPVDPPILESSELFRLEGMDLLWNEDPNNPIVAINDGGNVFYEVEISNAVTAYRAELILKDQFNNYHTVVILEGTGTDGVSYMEGNTFYFAIPDTMAGNRNGKWIIESVRLYGVYDGDGVFYGDPNYGMDEAAMAANVMTVSQSTTEFYTLDTPYAVTIIEEFSVTISNTNSTLGKDGNTINKGFMADQTISADAIQVGIDLSGVELPDGLRISGAVLTLRHNQNTSGSYGGYTYTDTNSEYATITIPLTQSANGHFVPANNAVVRLAGTYYAEVTFNLEGVTTESIPFSKKVEKTSGNTAVLQVWSLTPTVEITAANYASKDGGAVSITNKKNVTVTFQQTTKSGSCNKTYTGYNSPSVQITLSNYGSANSAKLVFTESGNGTVYLYKTGGSNKSNSDQTNAFEWSGNGAVTRYVGQYTYRNNSNDEMVKAGTLKANQLTLTYGSLTCYVDVGEINISNPS